VVKAKYIIKDPIKNDKAWTMQRNESCKLEINIFIYLFYLDYFCFYFIYLEKISFYLGKSLKPSV